MAEGRVLIKKSTLTEIGNAIREKTGNTDLINPDNMPQEIESIEKGITPSGTLDITENGEYDVTEKASVNVNVAGSGGGVDYLGLRLSQTEKYEYGNNVVTKIPQYFFYEDDKITGVNFPNVTQVDMYGFYGCDNLKTVKLPNLITIQQNAFSVNTKLESIDFPNLVNVNKLGFNNCTSLTSVNLPKITRVANSMFSKCLSLPHINLPEVTSIESYGFEDCMVLKSIYLPKITTIGTYGFRSCSGLTAVILPSSSVATLSSNNGFLGCTQIQTYHTGYIYVPDNLLATYKAATNWSVFADQIKGLSQLPQEYADLYGIEIPEAPAGYTLTLNCDSEVLNDEYKVYSLDNGNTWLQFTSETMTLQNVTQIKFSELSAGAYRLQVGTTLGGRDIADLLYEESENITLSANTTLYVQAQAGGGYD